MPEAEVDFHSKAFVVFTETGAKTWVGVSHKQPDTSLSERVTFTLFYPFRTGFVDRITRIVKAFILKPRP